MSQQEMHSTILNVIFHGPFNYMFYPKPDKKVEAPDEKGKGDYHYAEVFAIASQEHIFGAGNLMEESPILPGSYHLTGLGKSDRTTTFSKPSQFINWEIMESDLNMSNTYFKFQLPAPDLVRAYTVLTPSDPPIFVGSDSTAANHVKEFGTVHVFSYHNLTGAEHLELEGSQWVPILRDPISEGAPCAYNLHIFAEAGFATDSQHPRRDFSSLIQMIPKKSISIRSFPPLAHLDVITHDKHLNILDQEQRGLRGISPYERHGIVTRPPAICGSPSNFIFVQPR